MRTVNEYKEVKVFWKYGFNKSQISRITGIPRATIRDWVEERVKWVRGPVPQLAEGIDSNPIKCEFESHRGYYYSYLLGMYLGDGCLSKSRRVYRLRIALDKKYPKVIEECKEAISVVFPNNKVGEINCSGYKEIYCYKKDLPFFFPHGIGVKYKRVIKLEDWQKEVIAVYPIQFLKGLFHSDGCRYVDRGYIMYNFVNKSEEIINLFKYFCNRLGIKFNEHRKKNDVYNMRISKKWSAEFLDRFVGAKN